MQGLGTPAIHARAGRGAAPRDVLDKVAEIAGTRHGRNRLARSAMPEITGRALVARVSNVTLRNEAIARTAGRQAHTVPAAREGGARGRRTQLWTTRTVGGAAQIPAVLAHFAGLAYPVAANSGQSNIGTQNWKSGAREQPRNIVNVEDPADKPLPNHADFVRRDGEAHVDHSGV